MIKWRRARLFRLREIENIMIAICLRVESAMIFFKSCSQLAFILEYRVVSLEMIIRASI